MGVTYEGWSNQETWTVNLWVQNSPYVQRRWRGRTEVAFNTATPAANMNRHSIALMHLSDEIKAMLWNEYDSAILSEPFLALLSCAIGHVDQRELADQWLRTWCADYESPLDPLAQNRKLMEIF